MISSIRGWGIAAAFFVVLGNARADTFYVVVFGAESIPQRPKYSHSWATFVRLPGDCACGPPAGPKEVEWFTISWMPCKIDITPNRLLPEPGTNLDLAKTFEVVQSHCEQVAAFGPYQIDEWLFCKASQHWQKLESGEVRYKTIDVGYRPLNVSNCIHALTSFDREEHPRVRIGRTNFGEVASYFVAETYQPHMIGCQQIHCWVADLLGLGQYPIRWRTIEEGRPRPRDDG